MPETKFRREQAVIIYPFVRLIAFVIVRLCRFAFCCSPWQSHTKFHTIFRLEYLSSHHLSGVMCGSLHKAIYCVNIVPQSFHEVLPVGDKQNKLGFVLARYTLVFITKDIAIKTHHIFCTTTVIFRNITVTVYTVNRFTCVRAF